MDTDTHTFNVGHDQVGSDGARPPQELWAFLISLRADRDPVLLVDCFLHGSRQFSKTQNRIKGRRQDAERVVFPLYGECQNET